VFRDVIEKTDTEPGQFFFLLGIGQPVEL